jgi:hypothetical protein
MILKRQEKDEIIRAMYDSSNILGSVYDKKSQDLTLIFNKGKQYKYPKVKPTDYTRFELAESQGKVFNSHIKTYSFEKLDDINPDNIIEEISNIKKIEAEALVKYKQMKLVNIMKSLVDNGDVRFTEQQLGLLTVCIDAYLSELNK